MDVARKLREHGIAPSAQRGAIAASVLEASDHPTADQVLARARARLPQLSRATTYATLQLFVERGLLRKLALTEGRIVFDPRTDHHHHLIDDEGLLHDLPSDALRIEGLDRLEGIEVDEASVIVRGRRVSS